MKTLIILMLLISSSCVFADNVTNINQSQGNVRVVTNDNRVVYSQEDKRLYSVQNQTICDAQGKKCFTRGVATEIKK